MFRFTIRDLIWLTVVVAIVLCWWLDRSVVVRLAEKGQRSLIEIVESQEKLIQDLRKASPRPVISQPPVISHLDADPKASPDEN